MRIYAIVTRNIDLPNVSKICMTSGRIAAHVAHAVLKMAQSDQTGVELWDCDIIVLSVPNSSDFTSLIEQLKAKNIEFDTYLDTDRLWEGEQLTAVCTHPLSKEQGTVLSHLKPWKCACNDSSKNGLRACSSTVEQSVLTDRMTAGRSSGAPDSSIV